jgi:hypothetical protein
VSDQLRALLAGVAVAVDDDVVVNQNSQKLCDADDRFRHPNIRLRWRRITRRVVVHLT